MQNFSATISFMKYITLIFIFLLGGCSIKEYAHTQTKMLIIKSPQIKFADLAYLRNTKQSIELEMFVAGRAVEKITINHLICVSTGCMGKSNFNKEYLHPSYPSDLLQNIFLAQAIYDRKNLIKTADGFEQTIIDDEVEIYYKKIGTGVEFRDRKNNILFKIKDIN